MPDQRFSRFFDDLTAHRENYTKNTAFVNDDRTGCHLNIKHAHFF
jgi:hypothetical protein